MSTVIDFPGEFHMPEIRRSEAVERLSDLMEMAEGCATAMREAAAIIREDQDARDEIIAALTEESISRLIVDAEGWETFAQIVGIALREAQKKAQN